MGSVCFKVEKDCLPRKNNQISAEKPGRSLGQIKRAVLKKNALSIKQTFIVRQPVLNKPKRESEACKFAQSHPQPVVSVPSWSNQSCGDLKTQEKVPQKVTDDLDDSLSSKSQDSWTQERSPEGVPVSLAGGVSVFKIYQTFSPSKSKISGSVGSKQTTAISLPELSFSCRESANRSPVESPQGTHLCFDQLIRNDGLEMSPNYSAQNKPSKVCKIRSELKKLALEVRRC